MKTSLLVLLLSLNVQAKDITYNCTPAADAYLNWDTVDKKFGATAEAKESDKDQVTFIVGNKKATLKKNGDSSEMSALTSDTFLEMAPKETPIVWRIYPAKGSSPSILVSLKTYDLTGPVVTSSMYRCK